MPQRPMALFAGPLRAVTTSFDQSPSDQRASLWWPEDRAWCVATDTDLMSTYVAGSAACIGAVASDSRLDSWPVTAGQSLLWDSDNINSSPPPPM